MISMKQLATMAKRMFTRRKQERPAPVIKVAHPPVPRKALPVDRDISRGRVPVAIRRRRRVQRKARRVTRRNRKHT